MMVHHRDTQLASVIGLRRRRDEGSQDLELRLGDAGHVVSGQSLQLRTQLRCNRRIAGASISGSASQWSRRGSGRTDVTCDQLLVLIGNIAQLRSPAISRCRSGVEGGGQPSTPSSHGTMQPWSRQTRTKSP